jgi:beta-1,4-mannosyltransferase
VDLPMKIADLLGAGVPVCALDYGSTLREMLEPGRNALLFHDGIELAGCLDALFGGWPEASPLWTELRAGAQRASAGPRWIERWQLEAGPVILSR